MKVVDSGNRNPVGIGFTAMIRGRVYRTNQDHIQGAFYLRTDDDQAVRIDSAHPLNTGVLVEGRDFAPTVRFIEVEATLSVGGDAK